MHYDQVKVQQQVNSFTAVSVLLLLSAPTLSPLPPLSPVAPLPQQQQHHQHNMHTTSELSNIYTILLYIGLPKARIVHLRKNRLPLCHFYYILQ